MGHARRGGAGNIEDQTKRANENQKGQLGQQQRRRQAAATGQPPPQECNSGQKDLTRGQKHVALQGEEPTPEQAKAKNGKGDPLIGENEPPRILGIVALQFGGIGFCRAASSLYPLSLL